MPPNPGQNQPPSEQDKIDISLELVGQQSLTAINALTDAVSRLQQHTAAQAGTPGTANQAAQSMAKEMRGGVAHARGGMPSHAADTAAEPTGMGVSEGASTPDRLPTREAPMPKGMDRIQLAWDARRAAGQGFIGNWIGLGQPLEQQRLDQMGQPVGGLSSGASAPGGGGPTGPGGGPPGTPPSGGPPLGWQSYLNRDPERLARTDPNRPFSLSQLPFGEYTTQMKLQMVGDFFTSRARTADAAAPGTGAGRFSGNMGALLEQASDRAASVQILQQEYGRIAGRGRDAVERGRALGYDVAGGTTIGIPGTSDQVGIRIPSTGSGSAFREGLRQTWEKWRLQAMPGITGDQAGQIVGSLAQAGWSGNEASILGSRVLAPLTQQGLSPEITSQQADRALRMGSGSMREFVTTLSGLGQVARETRMPLDELQQAMGQFAEQTQQMGGTYMQGLKTARGFSAATGLPPQVGEQLRGNPLVQGMAMTTMGIMPQQMGLLGGGQLAQLAVQSTQMTNALMSPFGRMGEQTIQAPGGRTIRTGEPDDRQIAMTATQLGVAPEYARELLKHPQRIINRGKAQDLLQSTLDAEDRMKNTHRGSHEAIRARQQLRRAQREQQDFEEGKGPHDPGGIRGWIRHNIPNPLIPEDQRDSPDRAILARRVNAAEERVARAENRLTPAERTRLRQGTGKSASISEIEKQMESAGISSGRIRAIETYQRSHLAQGEAPEHSILRGLRDEIAKTGKIKPEDSGPTVTVKFKGAAEKFFQQVMNTDDWKDAQKKANAGGQSKQDFSAGTGNIGVNTGKYLAPGLSNLTGQ